MGEAEELGLEDAEEERLIEEEEQRRKNEELKKKRNEEEQRRLWEEEERRRRAPFVLCDATGEYVFNKLFPPFPDSPYSSTFSCTDGQPSPLSTFNHTILDSNTPPPLLRLPPAPAMHSRKLSRLTWFYNIYSVKLTFCMRSCSSLKFGPRVPNNAAEAATRRSSASRLGVMRSTLQFQQVYMAF